MIFLIVGERDATIFYDENRKTSIKIGLLEAEDEKDARNQLRELVDDPHNWTVVEPGSFTEFSILTP